MIRFACCFILQKLNAEQQAHAYFHICQNSYDATCKRWITITFLPNRTCSKKILGKLTIRILRKTFDCLVLLLPTWIFYCATRTPFPRMEIICTSRIYMLRWILSLLPNQNLLNCVPDKFDGVGYCWKAWYTRDCKTVSGQRIHDVCSKILVLHQLKFGHCHNLFLL